MRALLVLAVAALLALPVVAAQTLISPVQGSFETTYVMTGRAVDKDGKPIVYGTVEATLDAPGVHAEPVKIGTNCYGSFIGYFTLRGVDPRGSITVKLSGDAGSATDKKPLDPFYRRSDFRLEYPGAWTGRVCQDTVQSLWEGRVSFSARLVKRVAHTESEGASLDAQPFTGYARLAFVEANGNRHCPPQGDDPSVCEPIFVDERGDVQYSWTFERPISPDGHVEINTGNRTFNLTVDPKLRIAMGEIEVTGQGPPESKPSPAAPLVLVGAGVALAALASRRLLPRRPA